MKLEDYSKYYIQGSDHYLIPKDIFVELFNEMINWKEENEILKARLELFENGVYFSRENDRLKEENEKLKKQLENKYSKTGTLTNEVLYEENTKLINQQQEFIKYLEDEIEKLKNEIFVNSLTGDDLDLYIMRVKLFKLNEILQKYKEIIGNDINVGSKGENKNENI